MKKTSCWIISCLFLFSFYPCATGGEKKSNLSPKGYKMSKELNIDNPDEYWTKDWSEIDRDQDGYLSKDEIYEAYPKHGKDAFPYYDQNRDGWISSDEYFDIYE